MNTNAAIATHCPTVRRHGGHAEVGRWLHPGQVIPQRPRVPEDFHWADRGRRKCVVQEQYSDINHSAPSTSNECWLDHPPIMANLPSCPQAFGPLFSRHRKTS